MAWPLPEGEEKFIDALVAEHAWGDHEDEPEPGCPKCQQKQDEEEAEEED